ncbi:MAG: cobyrinate a,c-diamide synthase [Pseudomonadota bacterium]
MNYPRIAIAALKGGAGKTVLSAGIIMALRKRGFGVVPFKKGPDYIDAGWLALAANQPCYNLDPFLMEKDRILSSFLSRMKEGQFAIIEGNRGLFDGTDEAGTYSTAELAKLLQTPVILIVDCTKVTRTAAAMVLGCVKFDPSIEIKGVILNQIAGSRHETMVRNTIEHYCGIPVIGAIPRLRGGELPERHMGLVPHLEHEASIQALSAISETVDQNIDIERLTDLALQAGPLDAGPGMTCACLGADARVAVGVIRDSAFQFYYPENLEDLVRNGADLVDISPLRDREVPEIDALYIGGGFPETHAEVLAANRTFADSMRAKVDKGLPVYAECGGLIYLGRSITIDGAAYPMSGVLPIDLCLGKKPQGHGYTELVVDRENPYFSPGHILRGHEFHYSRVQKWDRQSGMYMAFRIKRGYGVDGERDGFCYKNVLATYTHIHALGMVEWADIIMKKAREHKESRDRTRLVLRRFGGM